MYEASFKQTEIRRSHPPHDAQNKHCISHGASGGGGGGRDATAPVQGGNCPCRFACSQMLTVLASMQVNVDLATIRILGILCDLWCQSHVYTTPWKSSPLKTFSPHPPPPTPIFSTLSLSCYTLCFCVCVGGRHLAFVGAAFVGDSLS
jgi:hypothetical protein